MEAIGHIFERTCAEAGGQVISASKAKSGWLLRARWASAEGRIQQGDTVYGGLAAHIGTELSYYLYSERLVCTNGAVRRHAELARALSVPETEEAFLESLRPAIAWASAGRAAQQHARDLAESMAIPMTPELTGWVSEQLALLGSLQKAQAVAAQVEMAFAEEEGRMFAVRAAIVRQRRRALQPARQRTVFETVQAVTAAARDTRDPELKWALERLGGDLLDYGLAAGPAPVTPNDSRYRLFRQGQEAAQILEIAGPAWAQSALQQRNAAVAQAAYASGLRPAEPVQ